MSQVIDTAGALVAAPAGSAPPWETIFSEKGTINRYNPPPNLPYWRNSDYDRIKIDWFFANNGVRLWASGNYTRIAGTLLSQSGNNATSHWVHSIPNTTQAIVPGAQTTSHHNGSQLHPYGNWVAGEIQLHRNTINPTWWRGFIKIDTAVATYNGVIVADCSRLAPLMDVNSHNYMSLNIMGRTA